MTVAPYSLGEAVEGSRGTVVFGNGVPALTGEVVRATSDHIALAVGDDVQGRAVRRYVIPLTSIVYYRYSDDD